MNKLVKKIKGIVDRATKENAPVTVSCTASNDKLRLAMGLVNLRDCKLHKATRYATRITAVPKQIIDSFFG